MTQQQKLIILLREGPKSLGQILHPTLGLQAEYRRTMTDLRKQGYKIVYHRVLRCPACATGYPVSPQCPAWQRREAVYRLEGEPRMAEAVRQEEQLRLALA